YQVEPFGTLFQLNGDTFAWIFLGSLLVISIFFNRFYCKYICPAGAGMALLSSLRMREIKRWPECKKCMICANQCEPQAIKGDHISSFECMNCRGCEKLYLNRKICPHYALERVAAKKQEASIHS
ncbi:MAG: 4Fe-4S binding protein, partial [Nitrososphaerales archaeon]